MTSTANIKSISYLKSHAAQISEDLALHGKPFFIAIEYVDVVTAHSQDFPALLMRRLLKM